MATSIRAHGSTHPGRVYPRNEDSHAIAHCGDGAVLLVVCDGMGGMGRGDEASQLAVKELVRAIDSSSGEVPERLRNAILGADRLLRERLCADGRGRPGSTTVLVHIARGEAHVAWAGDSRAYLVRDGAVLERTRDHKLVQELLDSGQLTEAEARHSTWSSVVTRALGGRTPGEPAVIPEVLDKPWTLALGDRLMLCSDGLCDLVRDDEVPHHLVGAPGGATEDLIHVALRRGGHDNITVIVAAVEDSDWVPPEPAEPGAERSRPAPPRALPIVAFIAAMGLCAWFIVRWLRS